MCIYTLCPAPWNGENTPRTLGFALVTGFVTLRSLSPDEFRSSSAFASTWLCSRLRTQMTFSRPLTARTRTSQHCDGRVSGVRGWGRTVLAADNWMLMWPGRHGDLDGGIRLRKGREVVFEECAVVAAQLSVSRPSSFFRHSHERDSLHPATATRPVAVVELEPFALEHERTHSVLRFRHETYRRYGHRRGFGNVMARAARVRLSYGEVRWALLR